MFVWNTLFYTAVKVNAGIICFFLQLIEFPEKHSEAKGKNKQHNLLAKVKKNHKGDKHKTYAENFKHLQMHVYS